MDLTRIGVSIPSDLLNKFDKIIEQRGYSSRSEGIRDAIRSYILHYEWMSNIEGERIGIISSLYDHHKHGLSEELTAIQHEYIDIINSSIHIHIDKNLCIEVTIAKGDGKRIKKMAEDIMAQKGVEQVRLITIATTNNDTGLKNQTNMR